MFGFPWATTICIVFIGTSRAKWKNPSMGIFPIKKCYETCKRQSSWITRADNLSIALLIHSKNSYCRDSDLRKRLDNWQNLSVTKNKRRWAKKIKDYRISDTKLRDLSHERKLTMSFCYWSSFTLPQKQKRCAG